MAMLTVDPLLVIMWQREQLQPLTSTRLGSQISKQLIIGRPLLQSECCSSKLAPVSANGEVGGCFWSIKLGLRELEEKTDTKQEVTKSAGSIGYRCVIDCPCFTDLINYFLTYLSLGYYYWCFPRPKGHEILSGCYWLCETS